MAGDVQAISLFSAGSYLKSGLAVSNSRSLGNGSLPIIYVDNGLNLDQYQSGPGHVGLP